LVLAVPWLQFGLATIWLSSDLAMAVAWLWLAVVWLGCGLIWLGLVVAC
jgi:hypothetical protein